MCGHKLRSCFCSPCQESLLRFSPYTDASRLCLIHTFGKTYILRVFHWSYQPKERKHGSASAVLQLNSNGDLMNGAHAHTHQEYKQTNALTFLRLLHWQGFNPIVYYYMIDTSDISCAIHKGQGHFHLPLPVVCV